MPLCQSKHRPGLTILRLLCVLSILQSSVATQHVVGDSAGWNIGTHYIPWISKKIFELGDSLLFSYPAKTHSVYEISQADYEACNIDDPIRTYSDGRSVVQLPEPTYYYVGVDQGRCKEGMKLAVTVLPATSPDGSASSSPPPIHSPEPPPCTLSPPPPPSVPSPRPPTLGPPPPPSVPSPAPPTLSPPAPPSTPSPFPIVLSPPPPPPTPSPIPITPSAPSSAPTHQTSASTTLTSNVLAVLFAAILGAVSLVM